MTEVWSRSSDRSSKFKFKTKMKQVRGIVWIPPTDSMKNEWSSNRRICRLISKLERLQDLQVIKGQTRKKHDVFLLTKHRENQSMKISAIPMEKWCGEETVSSGSEFLVCPCSWFWFVSNRFLKCYLHWKVSEEVKAATRLPPERWKRNKINKTSRDFSFLYVFMRYCPLKRHAWQPGLPIYLFDNNNECLLMKWSDSATQAKWLTVRVFEMPLSKSKMITRKTPSKKPYTRMVQWKWPSVLRGTRAWTSSNYTSSALRFHKTLKSAEVGKIFLLLYFSVIHFQLVIAGGILILTSWCCRFTPSWRHTVTSLRKQVLIRCQKSFTYNIKYIKHREENWKYDA